MMPRRWNVEDVEGDGAVVEGDVGGEGADEENSGGAWYGCSEKAGAVEGEERDRGGERRRRRARCVCVLV